MNPIIVDLEAFVAAYEARHWLTVIQLGLKIATEIAAAIGQAAVTKAHAVALRGGEEAVLLVSLKSEIASAKSTSTGIVASAIPWGNLLALVMALLQKLFPSIASNTP